MTTHDIDREWIVALCCRERSLGALRMGCWLAERAAPAGWRVQGVHVITRDPAVVRDHPELIESARRRVREELAALQDRAATGCSMGEIEIVEAASAVDGLRAMLQQDHGIHGLVIGRTSGEQALVRLGRTAHRLLRECDVPVVVVDPELDRARLESGPVLVAVGLTDRCARATAWARRVAEGLDRPLRLVHVAGVPEWPSMDAPMVPEPTRLRLETIRERAELALAQWQADHGLESLRAQAVLGPRLVDRLLEHAREVDACMLVCGARVHDPHEQHEPSPEPGLSVELASVSPWPVAVIRSLPVATTVPHDDGKVEGDPTSPPSRLDLDLIRSEGEGMVTERAKVHADHLGELPEPEPEH